MKRQCGGRPNISKVGDRKRRSGGLKNSSVPVSARQCRQYPSVKLIRRAEDFTRKGEILNLDFLIGSYSSTIHHHDHYPVLYNGNTTTKCGHEGTVFNAPRPTICTLRYKHT